MDGIAYYPWDEKKQTVTVWFDREAEDFRPCNRSGANISSEMDVFKAIESLK